MECFPKNPSVCNGSQLKNVDMWAAAGKVMGMRLPGPFKDNITTLCLDAWYGDTGFNVCPHGFYSYFLLAVHYFPIFLSFEMRVFAGAIVS